MLFWEILWTATLAISILFFAGLSIVVTVGAVGDIKSLFRSIGGEQGGAEERSKDGSES